MHCYLQQEMVADFDSEMRKREHEFHLKLDEMNSVVLSHELKVRPTYFEVLITFMFTPVIVNLESKVSLPLVLLLQ